MLPRHIHELWKILKNRVCCLSVQLAFGISLSQTVTHHDLCFYNSVENAARMLSMPSAGAWICPFASLHVTLCVLTNTQISVPWLVRHWLVTHYGNSV